ncbi:hypothetical protein NN6n1_06830 [Shinella zoogloeoides]
MRAPFRGRRIFSACSLALALLAGCQSGSAPEALGSAAQESKAAAADVSTTVGSGGAHVDLFIDRSMPGSADDYRDGAALAAKELGAGKLALSVHDLRTGAGDLVGEVRKAAAGGSRFFIGPPSLSGAVAAGASGSAMVLLASEPSAGGGAIVSDEIDELVEVAAYAAGAGRKDIMAVASRHLSDAETQRLRSGLKKAGANLLDIVIDPSSPAGKKSLAKLGSVQAVMLIGADAPKVIAPILRQGGALPADVPFLGTATWPASSYAEPALEGAMLALIDQTRLKRISTRFQTAYGRPLSLDAAYAFDAVAVAAGVVRAKGEQGLNADALRSASGFAGATGVFRFDAQGRVERRFAIYRLTRGKPSLLDAAPAGF